MKTVILKLTLYTASEGKIRNLLQTLPHDLHLGDRETIEILTPPTDTEIEAEAVPYGITERTEFGNTYDDRSVNDFYNGARWMREQIFKP